MKDVVGYEGLYAITSCGKVWSYKNECFMKPRTIRNGYLQVGLRKNGERKFYYIHRLVAEAYLPNTENLPEINHKDENKANNCLQNLEWCDHKYNINYGTRTKKTKKPILQYTLNGEFVREWPSATDVRNEANGNICNCLKGRLPSAYGYIWKFKE